MVLIEARVGSLDCQGLKRHSLLVRTLRLLLVTMAALLPVSASLVSYPEISVGGTGRGAVPYVVLDMLNAGQSTAASGAVCWGITPAGGPLADMYGDACNYGTTTFGNLQDAGWSHTWTPGQMGILNPFNLAVIFDAAEPGNASKAPITVSQLVMTFYDPLTGEVIYSAVLEDPVSITTGTQGSGRSGHAFGLDWTQAVQLQNFIDGYVRGDGSTLSFSDVRIGLGTGLQEYDGHAFYYFSNMPGLVEIPEPGTFLLFGGGLLALGLAGRRFRRN